MIYLLKYQWQMGKVDYMKLDLFDRHYNDAIIHRKTFSLHETSYTKKLVMDGKSIIFNQEGMSNFKILPLINKVRHDAKEYINNNIIPDTPHITFFDLFDIPNHEDVIVKVDIRSAYWKYALINGIIKQDTDELFLNLYKNTNVEKSKGARLKALGSLATKKRITKFTDGVEIGIESKREDTVHLYRRIMSGIDMIMKDVQYTHSDSVVYYYWDCIFVKKDKYMNVVDHLRSMKFDIKTQETKLKLVNVGKTKMLVSISDNKKYMVRLDKKFLLDDIDNGLIKTIKI